MRQILTQTDPIPYDNVAANIKYDDDQEDVHIQLCLVQDTQNPNKGTGVPSFIISHPHIGMWHLPITEEMHTLIHKHLC